MKFKGNRYEETKKYITFLRVSSSNSRCLTVCDCEGVSAWALDGGICAGVIESNRRGFLEADATTSMKGTTISWSSGSTCCRGGSTSIMSSKHLQQWYHNNS